MGNFKFLTAFLFAFLFSVMGYGQEVLLNGGFESGVAKWKSYCDAAGTAPVDGVGGGGAGFTITSSTTSPLAGKASGIITKDAANRQGCGVASDFTLANENKAKVLQIKLSYQVASGTYADDQYKVYVYDVDNSTLIEAAPTFIKNSSLVEQYRGVFQATLTGVNYRLIIHNASTSAVASTLRIEASVSSQLVAQGSYVGDWTQYTPTFGGFGTPTNVSMWWKIVGDNILIKGTFNSGITTAAIGTVSLPAGLSIDTSKISTSTYKTSFGRGWRAPISGGSNLTTGSASVDNVYNGTTTLVQMASSTNTSPGYNNDNASTLANNTDLINIELLTIPIAGLGSNSALSSEYQARSASLFTTLSSYTHPTSATFQVVTGWAAATTDSLGAFNPTTGIYTCPFSAFYKVNATIAFGASTTGARYLGVRKNSTDVAYGTQANAANFGAGAPPNTTVTAGVQCNAGETLSIRAYQTSGGSLAFTVGAESNLSIWVDNGGTQVAAGESISARYYQTAAQSIPDSTQTVINFDIKDYDNANSVTTGVGWVFTASQSGKYRINCQIGLAAGTGFNGTTELLGLGIVVNGGEVVQNIIYPSSTSNTKYVAVNGTFNRKTNPK